MTALRDELVQTGANALQRHGGVFEEHEGFRPERFEPARHLGTADIDLVISRHRALAEAIGDNSGYQRGQARGAEYAASRFVDAGNAIGTKLALELRRLEESLACLRPGPKESDRRTRKETREQLGLELARLHQLTPLFTEFGTLIAEAAGTD
jgi:hypothetical protein